MTTKNYSPANFMQISDPAALGKFVTSELSKISNSIGLANQQIAINGVAPVLGTAATKNVGVAAGNVVQLDVVTAKLPAVDGSLLTNLPSPAPPALPVALKTDQQTGTSTTLAVTPAHHQDHDSSAKAWVSITGSTGAIQASYNVPSVTRVSAGVYDITFTTLFANTNYAVSVSLEQTGPGQGFMSAVGNASRTTSSVRVTTFNSVFAAIDVASIFVVCYGRQ